jgi:hypothetical protein
MAGVFSVEGKLGTGKTKFAVWRAQLALLEGRRVASNVDLFLDKLTPRQRSSYMRLPDKPTAFDLEAIGRGSEGKYDEDAFGVLILDELGTWLNSRSFQDKERAKVLDWLIHARKHRWEVYLIVQDANMIDKQVRESLIEYQCKCLRMDKVKVPFVGTLINDIAQGIMGRKAKRWGYLPRFHLVTSRVGEGANKVVAERWMYRGDHLHAGYDTEQVFTPDYPHGAHSVLPPWDWKQPQTLLQRWKAAFERVTGARLADGLRPAPVAPRHPLVERIRQCLPPDERIRHLQRLQRLGLLG